MEKEIKAIFIDDSIKNCDGAKRLGIDTIVLNRSWSLYFHNKLTCRNHKVIRTFKGIKQLVV
ncbi:hypothetical protein ACFIJ5_08190 [Haloimpatiens sp. FM7330]|uniref:hypothetical protein n=1 Tax=Haloimpatiens sp. FM7330 TaxID=3298610 RepID=UPI003642FA8F